MSYYHGSGYYKYHCKFWLIHNCQNWLWVNNEACAACLVAGRDEPVISPSQFQSSSTASTNTNTPSTTSTNTNIPSTTSTNTNIPSTQPASISPPAPPGQWFIQEPGQKWSERWASATDYEKGRYAFELAAAGGHGMAIMSTTSSENVKAPEHWVHNDTV